MENVIKSLPQSPRYYNDNSKHKQTENQSFTKVSNSNKRLLIKPLIIEKYKGVGLD